MKKAAEIIFQKKDEVLKTWQNEVRLKVEAAKTANKIALIDHLPFLLDDIVKVMERHSSSAGKTERTPEEFHEIISNSSEHGRHRAATAHYTVEQVIHEYIIFHRTLTNFLHKEKIYDTETSELLKYVIETAILRSSQTFSKSIQEMQEKLLGTLAHDIRNPLTVAANALELMGDKSYNSNYDSIIKMARNSVHKAIKLAEGLLDTITVKSGESIMLTFFGKKLCKRTETNTPGSK